MKKRLKISLTVFSSVLVVLFIGLSSFIYIIEKLFIEFIIFFEVRHQNNPLLSRLR